MVKLIGRLETGCLVISLDLEMMWGNLEHWTIEGYGKSNVSNVREVVTKLVALFEKYDVHATFATVGLLMMDDKREAMKNIPQAPPTYVNKKLSPFEGGVIEKIPSEYESLYFAPDLVDFLKASPNIEIGTHTFSHFFCWEDGQTLEQFQNDIKIAQKVCEAKGIRMRSIVFPRNNVSQEYLNVCKKMGIISYRGNPSRYFSKPTGLKAPLLKIMRLLDVYVNTLNKTSYAEIDLSKEPINIPASRFFRPYSRKLRILEYFRLRRIKKEMIYAAKNKEIYHLWWHPHNFGANTEKNFNALRKVLDCYAECREKFDMKSMNMNEVCKYLNK